MKDDGNYFRLKSEFRDSQYVQVKVFNPATGRENLEDSEDEEDPFWVNLIKQIPHFFRYIVGLFQAVIALN
jgi:hypothetical protein